MLFRVVRTINDWYALTIFWMYMGLFLLAFALIFVFPLGPILLLFVGLASLGFAILGAKALRRAQAGLAHHSLAHGRCPNCQAPIGSALSSIDNWRCPQCGIEIDPSGNTPTAQAEGPDDLSGPSRRTQ